MAANPNITTLLARGAGGAVVFPLSPFDPFLLHLLEIDSNKAISQKLGTTTLAMQLAAHSACALATGLLWEHAVCVCETIRNRVAFKSSFLFFFLPSRIGPSKGRQAGLLSRDRLEGYLQWWVTQHTWDRDRPSVGSDLMCEIKHNIQTV